MVIRLINYYQSPVFEIPKAGDYLIGAGAGGNFGNTKRRMGSKSKKDRYLFGKPGQAKKSGYKETHIGFDGRATYEKHNTNHGNPKYHTNPHYHKIEWDKNRNPIFKNERK